MLAKFHCEKKVDQGRKRNKPKSNTQYDPSRLWCYAAGIFVAVFIYMVLQLNPDYRKRIPCRRKEVAPENRRNLCNEDVRTIDPEAEEQ